MLTVDFDRFPVGPGDRVLDLGCGDGRHAYEAYKRGADVVAADLDDTALKYVRDMFANLAKAGEAPATASAMAVRTDALRLPFPTGSFTRVIVAETLEHIHADRTVLAEASRVLAPGGRLVATVPRWWPERICWLLSDAYHEVEGGHIRIYRRRELLGRLTEAGLLPTGSHHAHALHSPYWWLKCAVGPDEEHRLCALYHRFLVWDIMRNPPPVRFAERALNPVLGKSLVVYARKP
ncbi:SAM-dependent methyltransferase [Amycolatopsis sp. WAC 01416]|uniref:class I SAM-dependent methyltransferase n=1 Tax=Amycolatopsis sp. WAC 01416 TaxID=2203196 RepID=UPI000F76755A|nr:class I SAM-dependent methyltransferase [Amycolatopsis sp. WAC 01416]RSN34262.1 SAM-dependent methyltransferase [Amycolatopsis sp. WAC 01416]